MPYRKLIKQRHSPDSLINRMGALYVIEAIECLFVLTPHGIKSLLSTCRGGIYLYRPDEIRLMTV